MLLLFFPTVILSRYSILYKDDAEVQIQKIKIYSSIVTKICVDTQFVCQILCYTCFSDLKLSTVRCHFICTIFISERP